MKNLKCPKCEQIGANRSMSYPFILVHKCDGMILEEVAKISEPDGTKKYNENYYDLNLEKSFTLKESFKMNSYDFLD